MVRLYKAFNMPAGGASLLMVMEQAISLRAGAFLGSTSSSASWFLAQASSCCLLVHMNLIEVWISCNHSYNQLIIVCLSVSVQWRLAEWTDGGRNRPPEGMSDTMFEFTSTLRNKEATGKISGKSSSGCV